MKKNILILIFVIYQINSYSQRLKNNNYELFLIEFNENEVDIAKGMYMTDNKQYYYEGIIEVTFMNNGETSEFNFFFSSWDDKFKDFVIKDSNFNIIKPRISFKDKEIAHVKKDNKEIEVKLLNNSNLENAILSSMIVWLDNR